MLHWLHACIHVHTETLYTTCMSGVAIPFNTCCSSQWWTLQTLVLNTNWSMFWRCKIYLLVRSYISSLGIALLALPPNRLSATNQIYFHIASSQNNKISTSITTYFPQQWSGTDYGALASVDSLQWSEWASNFCPWLEVMRSCDEHNLTTTF